MNDFGIFTASPDKGEVVLGTMIGPSPEIKYTKQRFQMLEFINNVIVKVLVYQTIDFKYKDPRKTLKQKITALQHVTDSNSKLRFISNRFVITI